MGQDIASAQFTKADFNNFANRLRRETVLLDEWFREDELVHEQSSIGVEVEAWLIDQQGLPLGENAAFIEAMDDPRVVPELSCFNVEFNSQSYALETGVLGALERELTEFHLQAQAVAAQLDGHMLFAGTLPSLLESDLTLRQMSDLDRYRAINQQLMRQRRGVPFRLAIEGRERLETDRRDVMFESAATSFQIHLQLDPRRAADHFRAAQLIAAPMVALGANSPYLFGLDLWDETRIPLFEQAVALVNAPVRRVSLGQGHVTDVMALFWENLETHEVLLPLLADSPPEQLAHLRLHNGTVWRWNRPIIDFNADGRPTLRIEHRVLPAGPTIVDSVANLAVFLGLLEAFSDQAERIQRLPFEHLERNFYQAARESLHASVVWLDGEAWELSTLLQQRLLDAAADGLIRLGVGREETEHYLGIIKARVESGATGANWQRRFLERYKGDMRALTSAYLEWQIAGQPVHTWDFAGVGD